MRAQWRRRKASGPECSTRSHPTGWALWRAAERRPPMDDANRTAHWENVYQTKGEREVSWFEETPSISLELIRSAGATRRSAIVDIGGGASRLVDALVDEGYEALTVLDLSESALAAAKTRMAATAARVT